MHAIAGATLGLEPAPLVVDAPLDLALNFSP